MTRRAPRCSSTSVNPPVDAPTSSASTPPTSRPNASTAVASLCPARATYGGGPSTSSDASASTHSPGFACPGTRPASTKACAWVLDSASPRSTSRTSSRFFTPSPAARRHGRRRDDRSSGADGETVDDGRKDVGVRVDLRKAGVRALRRLVGEAAGAVLADLDDVAVSVEQVVDDLEEQPELAGERAPRRMLRHGNLAGPESAHDRGREQGTGLQRVQPGEVDAAFEVELLAADHLQRRVDQLARDRAGRIREREPHCLGQERVPGENRGRPAELR